MVHDDGYEIRNCSKSSSRPSKSSFFKLLAKFGRFSQKLFVPLVQKFGQKVQNWGKKTKKKTIMSLFRKAVFLFPHERGAGVEGDGWKYGCGGEGVGGARRVWPCRPRSPLQNGTFWKESDAS